MIVARQKPIQDIAAMVGGCKNILLVGCGGCVSVCLAGGESETEILASALRLKGDMEGAPVETRTCMVPRQCEPEFIEALADKMEDVDAVISLGCGVGAQYLAERFPDRWVVPALDTVFAGGSLAKGVWEEKCSLCGDCVLHKTGGICPVTRCPKSILNGPCGGSQGGRCEINENMKCVWHLIYEQMKSLGKLDRMMKYQPPKDWSHSRDGGPRKHTREDVIAD